MAIRICPVCKARGIQRVIESYPELNLISAAAQHKAIVHHDLTDKESRLWREFMRTLPKLRRFREVFSRGG